MNVLNRSVELINPPDYKTLLSNVEQAARNCYRSQDKITDNSAEGMIRALIKSGHEGTIEFANLEFMITCDRACYDKDTQVLTKDGWKFFSEISYNDVLATLNPISNNVEFYNPTEIIKYKYSGDMVSINTTNCDLLITPNHNVWALKTDCRTKQHWQFHRADTLSNRYRFTKEFNYINNNCEDFVFIRGIDYTYSHKCGTVYHKHTKDIKMPKSVFVKLLAIYLSEGSVYHNKKEYSWRITLSQQDSTKNKETRKFIADVCEEAGFHACFDKKSVYFKNTTIGSFFKNLGLGINKYIPYNIFEFFNKEYARLFIDTYLMFDGTRDCGIYGKLYTSSKVLANQLEIISMIAGLSTKTFIHDEDLVGKDVIICGHICKRNAPAYIINLTNKQNKNPHIDVRKSVKNVAYNDNVYCVNIPNHIIMVKRNGVCVWCGNCSHQIVRHRIGVSYCQESMRFVNYSKDKFGNNVNFIVPHDITNETYETWRASCLASESAYFVLLEQGAKPETARSVLPQCTATHLVMQLNMRSLRHFLELRLDTHAQSDIRDIAYKMLMIVYDKYPVFVEDLVNKYGREYMKRKFKIETGKPFKFVPKSYLITEDGNTNKALNEICNKVAFMYNKNGSIAYDKGSCSEEFLDILVRSVINNVISVELPCQ